MHIFKESSVHITRQKLLLNAFVLKGEIGIYMFLKLVEKMFDGENKMSKGNIYWNNLFILNQVTT